MLALGAKSENTAHWGWVGGIGGALVGAPAGWRLGRVPYFIGRLWLHLILTREAPEQLRARLRDRRMWPLYRPVMEELQKRGAELRSELPLVSTLLTSDSIAQRQIGWAILRHFFPDLAAQVPNYDPFQTPEQCRA